MTISLSGSLLQTGKGFAGAPMALLRAPEGAAPGSLAALTEFFLEKHVRCLPGYLGAEQEPVLRLSGYGSEAALLALLKEDFPRWQEAKAIPAAERITVTADLAPQKLDTSELERHGNRVAQFLARHSNFLPAACYFIGDAGVMLSALKERKPLKIATAVAYSTAVVNMLVFGGKADRPRTAEEMMQAIDPVFRDANGREVAHKASSSAFAFLQRHPWEVTGLLNMAGGGMQLLAGALRMRTPLPGEERNLLKQSLEMFTGGAMMAGQAVQSFVPEKGVDSFLKVGESLEARRAATATLSDETLLKEIMQQKQGDYQRWTDWVKDKPMRVTALLSAASNIGMGASGLAEAYKKQQYDKGNILASGSYLMGNYLQAKTSKVKGPSFDDIVTAAADRIASVPVKDSAARERQIEGVAEALRLMPEMRAAPERTAAAIRQRMQEKGSFVERFIGAEAEALRKSSFISTKLLGVTAPDPRTASINRKRIL